MSMICDLSDCAAPTLRCNPPGSPTDCFCRPLFHGPLCEEHYFTDRTDLFWSCNVITLVVFFGLFVMSVLLLLYWFRRVAPALKTSLSVQQKQAAQARNPQIYAMFAISLACLIRTMYGIVMCAAGPRIEYNYYLAPSFPQWLARFGYQFFYPLTFAAFLVQVLLWIDSLIMIKRMALTSPRWVWISFFVWLAILVAFEFAVEGVLLAGIEVVLVVRIYRAILALFLFVLLIMVAVFGFRFVYVMSTASPAASAVNEARRRSRKNLTRMVLISAAILLAALIATPVIAFVPTPTAGGYFAVQYVLRLLDASAVVMIQFTFLSMMRNRVDQLSRNAKLVDSAAPGVTSMDAELEEPLMGRIVDDFGQALDGASDDDVL